MFYVYLGWKMAFRANAGTGSSIWNWQGSNGFITEDERCANMSTRCDLHYRNNIVLDWSSANIKYVSK